MKQQEIPWRFYNKSSKKKKKSSISLLTHKSFRHWVYNRTLHIISPPMEVSDTRHKALSLSPAPTVHSSLPTLNFAHLQNFVRQTTLLCAGSVRNLESHSERTIYLARSPSLYRPATPISNTTSLSSSCAYLSVACQVDNYRRNLI